MRHAGGADAGTRCRGDVCVEIQSVGEGKWAGSRKMIRPPNEEGARSENERLGQRLACIGIPRASPYLSVHADWRMHARGHHKRALAETLVYDMDMRTRHMPEAHGKLARHQRVQDGTLGHCFPLHIFLSFYAAKDIRQLPLALSRPEVRAVILRSHHSHSPPSAPPTPQSSSSTHRNPPPPSQTPSSPSPPPSPALAP